MRINPIFNTSINTVSITDHWFYMKQRPKCSLLLTQTTFIVDLVLRETFSAVSVVVDCRRYRAVS